MSLFPQSLLDACSAGEVPALRVSTKFMETFVPLQPVSSGTELRCYLNGQGSLDLYSVGSDSAVYRLRASRDSDAPYEELPLGVVASQLYLFTPANGDPDHPAIFGLDGQGRLQLASWRDGAYQQRPSGPDQDIVRRFLGVRGVSGRIYINVRLGDGRLASNYYDPIGDRWGGPVWTPVKGPDGKDAVVKDLAMAENDPVQSALFAIGHDDEVLFAEESFRSSQLRKLGKKATAIAAISDRKNLLNIFAVERDSGLLWVKRQREHSTSGIQFEDWVRVDPLQRRRLHRLHANLRRDGLLELFALDEAGDLNYGRQGLDQRGKEAGWLPLFPIATGEQNALFTVGRNASGYSEAFAVSPDNRLHRFWQAPESGQWFTEPLQVPPPADRLLPLPTHATEVFVVDAGGATVLNAPVTVNAAFLSTLWINGRAYRSSLVDPVSLNTGPSGKLVILQRANALAGATLLISTPSTPVGQPIKVEPNGQLQARLNRTSKEEVLNARDRNGQLLLPLDTKERERVAESLAEVTRRSMEIAQAEGPAGAIQYRFASLHGSGFRAESDFSALAPMAWEIDFSSGVPIYRNSSAASVAAFRTQHAAQAPNGSFLGIDWGSVWSGIKHAVRWVVDGLKKIIVTVVDGIASVLFHIGEQVFEAVIRFAQQAFDFIEGVWNWLKVKLNQLYEWLAFLFDFKDFARTAEGIKHTTGVILGFTADAVHSVRTQVEGGFDGLKKKLDGAVEQLLAYLNDTGEPSLGAYARQQPASEDQLQASDHNIFLNAFQQNDGRIRVASATAAAPALLNGPLQGLIEKLEALASNFQFGDGKEAFDQAFAYFDNIGKDPNRALQLLLSGVIKALEGAALFALDFAKGVVLTLFDLLEDVIRAVRAALFESWEIPVFSQLYQLFTGDKLTVTPVDVCAWVLALPMTLAAKVVLGRTPWTEAQLEAYKKDFNVAMLKARLGVIAAPELRRQAVEAWNPQWRENFLTGYCTVMVVRALVDPGAVMSNATGAGLGPAGIVPIALRLLGTCFTAPWALSAQAGAPSCQPGEPGFGVTIWICQLTFGPLRGGLIHYAMKPGEAKINVSELTLTLWGVAQLIMSAVNFGAMEKTRKNKLAFSRGILNFVPGQTLHFLALPALNRSTYLIPGGVLAALSFASFFGSFGVAIAEIHDGAETRGGDWART